VKSKPVSYRHRSKNTILNLPLIVEDIGLGLMLDTIKREHLVREGVAHTEGRNSRAHKTQNLNSLNRNNKLYMPSDPVKNTNASPIRQPVTKNELNDKDKSDLDHLPNTFKISGFRSSSLNQNTGNDS